MINILFSDFFHGQFDRKATSIGLPYFVFVFVRCISLQISKLQIRKKSGWGGANLHVLLIFLIFPKEVRGFQETALLVIFNL